MELKTTLALNRSGKMSNFKFIVQFSFLFSPNQDLEGEPRKNWSPSLRSLEKSDTKDWTRLKTDLIFCGLTFQNKCIDANWKSICTICNCVCDLYTLETGTRPIDRTNVGWVCKCLPIVINMSTAVINTSYAALSLKILG